VQTKLLKLSRFETKAIAYLFLPMAIAYLCKLMQINGVTHIFGFIANKKRQAEVEVKSAYPEHSLNKINL